MSTNEIKKYLKAIGKKGGESRAEKHSPAELRKWGKLGGRPKGKVKK